MKSKYSKLLIIGNGFDRWQGLPTSYGQFKEYYKNNIHSIVKELRIKTTVSKDDSLITPVEMIYGDIFNPTSLSEDFFWNFESSTALLDDQNIINYFKKTNRGLYNLQETVGDAQKILQKAFGDWIHSIVIETKDSGYRFDDSCYFINFNYTYTLEKRFGVDENKDYHIHGDADDPESIVFGHSTHPETAFPELMEQKFFRTLSGKKSKRLQGLYLIEAALYETDKHVQDNIDDLCEFMTLDGVHIEDITDIYVLGHSFGEPDYEYFEFLVQATQVGCDFNELSALWKIRNIGLEEMDEDKLLDYIQLNVAYATQHRKRAMEKDDIRFPQAEMLERMLFGQTGVYTDGDGIVHKNDERDEEAKSAVHKRFLMEQAARTKEVIEELCMLKDVHELPPDCFSILKAADYIDGGHEPRANNAKWHISYYSDKDRKQIENVMQRAGCDNYVLYQGIDECIKEFKV